MVPILRKDNIVPSNSTIATSMGIYLTQISVNL